MVNLFQLGNFTLNSGATSSFKIECDALTDDDWKTLAEVVRQMVGPFSSVEGVPRGGLKLAEELKKFIPMNPLSFVPFSHLIVDDVLTTGGSMERMRQVEHISRGSPEWVEPGWCIGAVIFARGPCPPWVRAVFQMPESLWITR